MVIGQSCQTMATCDEKIVQQESERGAFFVNFIMIAYFPTIACPNRSPFQLSEPNVYTLSSWRQNYKAMKSNKSTNDNEQRLKLVFNFAIGILREHTMRVYQPWPLFLGVNSCARESARNAKRKKYFGGWFLFKREPDRRSTNNKNRGGEARSQRSCGRWSEQSFCEELQREEQCRCQ